MCEIIPERFRIEPFIMVIFGGSGDLSRRKLLPALFHIYLEKNLPEDFSILGFASTPRPDEEYREIIKGAILEFSPALFKEEEWERFSRRLFYMQGGFEDKESYRRLSKRIEELAGASANAKREAIYYMAVPPHYLPDIIQNLSACNLCKGSFNTRLIAEKPFGRDRESAVKLNRIIAAAFDEEQVYRIDHYLGKETVQNIIFFRFANSIFEPLWNRSYIDHVQITVAENMGIENRALFYEKTGVVRDIVQNHILQLLALVAMEPPVGFDPDFIRNEKVKVFKSIRAMDGEHVGKYSVSGQYGPGKINGKDVPGYRMEKGISPASDVATFIALKLYIDNWRWADVPFYIRTGKRMKERITEISIHFRQPPLSLFGTACEDREPNVLVLGIQPHEGISLGFGVKRPGGGSQLYPVEMNFSYMKNLKYESHPPYERLLIDCMKGDMTLFARQDGIEAMWGVVDPIIKEWENSPQPGLPNYEAGTWGPEGSDKLIEKDGRKWRLK
ncbi:MAG: glucose-6-phosphate dehydrogenase [Nitrospirae bacterium]|nr:glucose-6-phosphate dehydrogenase [Nitrospirota bacterium]